MPDPSYMNFYVERAASDAPVVMACTQACGLALESDGHPADDADGYVQITKYTDGFEMGLCIIWPPTAPMPRPGATRGLGSAEVARKVLSPADMRAVLRAQIDDRATEAERYDALGQAQAAARLREEAGVIAGYL